MEARTYAATSFVFLSATSSTMQPSLRERVLQPRYVLLHLVESHSARSHEHIMASRAVHPVRDQGLGGAVDRGHHGRHPGAELDGQTQGLVLHDLLVEQDRKSTRLNSSHVAISYAVFCLKKKKSMVDYDNETLALGIN